jgi:hypothetical protein
MSTAHESSEDIPPQHPPNLDEHLLARSISN